MGGGISCPGGCSATLPDNTHLTLAAVPARGAVFSGWGGACTGHGACKLTMSASRVVRATFLRTPLKITSLTQPASRWGGRHAAHGKAPERAVTGSAAAAALVQELVAQTMERYCGGK